MQNDKFSEADAFGKIASHWTKWSEENRLYRFVLGISGGVDSTLCAALGCKIFGKENVIGVSMPCGKQSDMGDVDKVFECLGIKRVNVDIHDAVSSISDTLKFWNAIELRDDTITNLPPRIRMSVLYAVSQSIPNSTVLCTANLSETVVGFATLYGDHAGSYSPIWDLTKTEVVKLSKWLGMPKSLAEKTPIDGLQPLTDEEKLGLKYSDIDAYIRENAGTDEIKEKVNAKFNANRFKFEIVNVPHPSLGYPNYVGKVP